jgi:nitrate/TMAO reductase-like tetraheme cytochrome c subunit
MKYTVNLSDALQPLRLAFTAVALCCYAVAGQTAETDYEDARWDPIHFQPAIDNATNEQCLACHEEVLSNRVKAESPAGVKAENSIAWYQTLETYQGEQETFHRRHLVTPLAKELMNLQCNFCHRGHDPREEAVTPPAHEPPMHTLRKTVNPEKTCLRCHGQMNYKVMGLPKPWPEIRDGLKNNCLSCHVTFRTVRHQVTYLNADAIEEAAKDKGGDVCYGCHGGRAWYRIGYPYPRHEWPTMAPKVPDWAKDRPTESEERFRIKTDDKKDGE